jgi:hypothetical protein
MVIDSDDPGKVFHRHTNGSAQPLVMDDAAERYHATSCLADDGTVFQTGNPMQLGAKSRLDVLVTRAREWKFGKSAT